MLYTRFNGNIAVISTEPLYLNCFLRVFLIFHTNKKPGLRNQIRVLIYIDILLLI